MNDARAIGWTALVVSSFLVGSLSCTRFQEPRSASAGAAPSAEPTPEQLLPGAFETTHYGFFLAGKRVGWARIGARRVEPSGEYEVERASRFDLLRDGQSTLSERHEIYRYAARAPYRLLVAELTESEDGATTVRTLAPGDDGFELRTRSGSEQSRFAVGETAANLREPLDAMRRTLDGEVGVSASYVDFGFGRGRDEWSTMRNVGRTRVRIDGEDVELTRIEVTNDGADGKQAILVTHDGRVERMVNGGMAEGRRMDEAAATAPADALDALAAFDVPIDGLEGSTWDLGHLELEWRGSDVLLPEREFQHARWERQNELQIVVLNYAPPPSEAELKQRVPDAVEAELAPDPLCESDHPRMRQLAAEVVAGRENPWDKVVAIVHWVNANVVSSLSSNRTTALGVLEARAGDCSESTLLACALLRASGVPARRVEGVAYVGPSERILGCHAWVEVWIGRWIPVDPTWAQAPADVTHVCFGGERDSRIANSGAMHARATKVVRR